MIVEKVLKALRGLPVEEGERVGCKAHREIRVLRVQRVFKALQGHKDWVYRDLEVQLVLLVMSDHKDSKGWKVTKALKELQGQQVNKV
jgi:hypothetical protein